MHRRRGAGAAGLCMLILLTAGTLAAQTGHDHHSPYAGQAGSGIAGLSPAEVEQLRNGEGMGLARAAELNHYPGPKHVLDAAEQLGLSEEQRRETVEIFQEMKREAIRIGEEIIAKEEILARRFEHRHIDEKTLELLIHEIGTLQARLRLAHLRAHLEMAAILTPEQIAAYDTLRGYGQR
ncbi:MAG TPA: periplasmic heavy metal sensor [Thermoanaerobaculia bacterium]|nr:periplasmic heavy metal sensor [Thermoanaerobaculia bacterium]